MATAFAAEQTVEAPSVDARAWILMDYASGKVLAEGNADEKLDPASLTKIMTSYVVGQALLLVIIFILPGSHVITLFGDFICGILPFR